MVKRMPPGTYVNGLRFILPPTLSADGEKTLQLRFTSPDAAYTLRLRNGTVVIASGVDGPSNASISLSFDAWARLVGRETTSVALLESGEVKFEGDSALVKALLTVGGPAG
jgi:alkyl sulfatase BDS1-like metallo-beta-lactamase superfamily hydrolase